MAAISNVHTDFGITEDQEFAKRTGQLVMEFEREPLSGSAVEEVVRLQARVCVTPWTHAKQIVVESSAARLAFDGRGRRVGRRLV